MTNLDHLPPSLTATVADIAQKHTLPLALVGAIIQVESAGIPWAIRYEPGFYNKYVDPASTRGRAPCSSQTEARLLACSFGLMQIMGATARSVGFDGVFLTELCAPAVGVEYGCRYLAQLKKMHLKMHGFEGVVAAYNAGSPRKTLKGLWVNQAYIEKIRSAGGFA